MNSSSTDIIRIRAMHEFIDKGYLYPELDSAFYFTQLEYDFEKGLGFKKYMAFALSIQEIILHLSK